ncbi:MAG: OmpH family outer membrane protein [Syntrophorhabdaceae bacterium]|nr:OmpH family outer membrane protein [Syntrophorhabdaceae bacterium]
MGKISFLFALVILFVFSTVPDINAQTQKIGVFDMQRVMRESRKIQSYRASLEQEMNAKRILLKQKQDGVNALEEKLKKDRDRISQEEAIRQQERIANELKELKRLREDIDLEISKIDRELTLKAFKEINDVVRSIAEREGLSIVFERSLAGVAYLAEPLDITEKMIKAYDGTK